MRPFHVIVTGGTIDKVYDPYTGSMTHESSFINTILKNGRCPISYGISTLYLKDSLALSDKDRAELFNSILDIKLVDVVIITHGTDTIVTTANLLSHIPDKTIICVGSMIPYIIDNSDAEFNLGAAIAYSQVLPYGSYVTMNGVAYPHNQVRKNYTTQSFEYE